MGKKPRWEKTARLLLLSVDLLHGFAGPRHDRNDLRSERREARDGGGD